MIYQLFKIRALIFYFDQTDFPPTIRSGTFFQFQFPNATKGQATGPIQVINSNEIKKGETAEVTITYVSDVLLGDYSVGTNFKILVGAKHIGDGIIIEVIGWETRIA